MRLFATYLGSEHRNNAFGTIKQIAIMSLLVTFITILVGIWPGIVFKETAIYQFAKYDYHLNGPITEKSMDSILDHLPGEVRTFGVLSSASDVETKEKQARVQTTYYDLQDRSDLGLGPVNSAMLIGGDQHAEFPVLADIFTAKSLELEVGDEFTISARENGGPDSSRELTLTGLVAPTAGISGLYVPMEEQGASSIDQPLDTPIFSDLFLSHGSKPGSVWPDVGLSKLPPDLTGSSRQQELKSALAGVEQNIPKRIRDGLVLASVFVMLIYLFREHSTRLGQRSRQLAVLSSLGLSRRRILQFFGGEQLFLAVIPVTVGAILGLWYLGTVGIWLPRSAMYEVIGVVVGSFLVAVLISLWGLHQKLAKTDMARLLTAE